MDFPGCTFIQDSVLARNPDFSAFYLSANKSGLLSFLERLPAPATLFLPTNEALDESVRAANLTGEEAFNSPLATGALDYFVVTEPILTLDDFEDGQNLPTLLTSSIDDNLTAIVDDVNNQTQVFIASFGSIARIVTPPAYACNLVIYGIDGSLETEEAVVQQPLSTYIDVFLVPGGAEIPASFIIYEVDKGNTRGVAAAFLNAVRDGYAQELINLLQEAIPLPGGAESFAAIANSMIVQSSCAQVTPLIRELYPAIYSSARSLGVTAAELRRIPVDFPQLAACAHSL